MIRTILCVLFVILYLILSLPIMLVLVLVRQFRPEAAELAMLRVVQAAFRGVSLIAGAKLTVIGKERIPKEEAVLYVGNHQSIFDIVVTYAQVPDRTGFISKDSVKKVPVLNLNMVFLNCLFLKRDDIRQGLETIKKAIELVKNGVSVFIYPEGTRNRSEDETALQKFHSASVKVAQRADCSIVPVSVNGTAGLLERHFPALKASKVVVEFGEPVPYSSLTKEQRKQIGPYFQTIIRDMVIKNQELL